MVNLLKHSTTLVIDDFQGMRTMLTNFLKGMGMTDVDQADSAKEALALLATKNFDIVICDYNLGSGKNGQQVLEEARYKNFIGYSTIWVVVTAEKTMDMFMGAAETKPDDYLLKPVTQALLETRLNKLIEKKRSLESIEKAIRSKDYLHAIALCEAQLKERSANTQELLHIKSDLLMTIGNYPEAKAFFESILATRNIPWAKTGLGRVHFLTKDFSRAKEIFQEVLEENKMYLEAADWLAITLDALGDLEQAQNILLKAAELSPKATSRQKSLADVAYKNGALDLAQVSYEKAITLGTHSVYKNSGTYMGLAKVLTAKDNPEEALKVLNRSRVEFKNDPEAELQTAVIEGQAYQQMGQPEKANAALATAEELMNKHPGNISAATTMDMAAALFKLGQKDKACNLLENVVKNNHDNTGIINLVEAVFEDAGLGEEGNERIQKSSQEIININNQGVTLAEEGQYEEGIKLMKSALQTLPNNDLMITNLCGMMLKLMSRDGKDEQMIIELKEYLEQVKKINPANPRYNSYMKAVNDLVSASD